MGQLPRSRRVGVPAEKLLDAPRSSCRRLWHTSPRSEASLAASAARSSSHESGESTPQSILIVSIPRLHRNDGITHCDHLAACKDKRVLHTSVHNYSVADFLELRASGRLEINKEFQRNSVWRTPGKVYLIDSILRGYPIPKLYFRSKIDPKTQSSVREVVDGQQRLLAIFQFADDKLELTSRAREFNGLRYSNLDEEQKTQFLSYTFVAEQFINASDDDVLEVFSRINSYTVALNAAELRHAQYQGEFKWLVREMSQELTHFWEQFSVFSLTQRARMADDAFVADCLLQIAQGITGGEAKALERAYKELDASFPESAKTSAALQSAIDIVTENLSDALIAPLTRPPHLAMLLAAAAHVSTGLRTQGDNAWIARMDPLPPRPALPQSRAQWDQVRENLLALASIIELDDPPTERGAAAFWTSSSKATINLSSRRVRFPHYVEAFRVQG